MTNEEAIKRIAQGVRKRLLDDPTLDGVVISDGGPTLPTMFERGRAIVRLIVYCNRVCIALGEAGPPTPLATPLSGDGEADEFSVHSAITITVSELRQPVVPRVR